MFSPPVLLLLAVPPLVSASPPLRLHHRVFHPSLPDSPYSERAILHVSGSGPAAETRLVPSQTYAENLRDFFSAVEGLKDALYQVALERPGDIDQTQWATSSVLACHLPSSTSEAFTIHLDQHGAPFTLDYFLGPVPHDGACPKPIGRKASASAGSSPAQLRPIANTTVALRSPTFPPLPALRVPPPVSAEGKPIEQPREKSFIEKYWMYMVIAVIAMSLAPAPAEEGEARGQGSGGRK
ncbi:hypothetical protein GSI_00895 [Ganoderma sinense ZZ0214-1]|uniref:Uncharacterized protein n=1 Tax=Ganoderma sinense ZZ0214-1 TaxID=1077348 RepID=A0A2G8STZ4_9APHY|nr:hypothetical protein GSI_00895 [Ganoderma sinense ZZ0214-1]